MFKNKIFILIVSILIAITLILTAAFVLWNYMEKSPDATDPSQVAEKQVKPTKPTTAAQVQENTVLVKDVLTNLAAVDRYIKVSLAFELENKKAKVEFEHLLDSKVKGVIVQTLSDFTPEQIQGSKGLDLLTSTLLNKLNPMLQDGKIKQIMITDKAIQ